MTSGRRSVISDASSKSSKSSLLVLFLIKYFELIKVVLSSLCNFKQKDFINCTPEGRLTEMSMLLITILMLIKISSSTSTLKSGTKIQNNFSFNGSVIIKRVPRSYGFTNQRGLEIVQQNHNSLDGDGRGGLVCSLCIVVDEQFAAAYNLLDSTAIIAHMRKIVDRVSWIFRNIDWNDDGIPDNVGFEVISLVKGWIPYENEYFANYDIPKPSMELLGRFAALNFHHCCLGVGFTNRPFELNQVGVSFIASDTLQGGICDFRNPTPPLQSANVALISARGLRGSQLSENDLGNVLLHELGHTFGVLKHDMDLEPRCSGYDISQPIPADYISDSSTPLKGRFIMWGKDIQGMLTLKENNLDFSECSKASVRQILYSNLGRGKCLKLSQNEIPYCGNGIVEVPEECDCGNEIKCAADGCCGPRGSKSPCKMFKGIGDASKYRLLNHPSKTHKKTKSGASNNLIAYYRSHCAELIVVVTLIVSLY